MDFLFEHLPTEALFGLFCSLDPQISRSYSTVCKKWNQMSKDNELWRQYCLERWDKNPKESDCVKNWLIPVREGGGSKESRIDWKTFYQLRSLFESATAFIYLTPGASENLPLPKGDKVIFTIGWPSPEELSNFEKKCLAVLAKANEKADEINDDGYLNLMEYLAYMDFFFELELSILRQINISRVKYLGSAGRFLAQTTHWCRKYPEQITSRLAKFAERYTALALQKDIPMEVFVQCLEEIALVYSDLLVNVNLPESSISDLVVFCSVIIKRMSEVLNVELKQWANEERNHRPVSPTKPYEKILLEISNGFFRKAYIGMPMFIRAIDRALGSVLETDNQIATMFAMLSAVTPGLNRYVATNADRYMNNFILPFWQSFKKCQNTEYMLALSFYLSNILESVGLDIPATYATAIISPLFDIATHANHNIQRQVAILVHSYCSNLFNIKALVPYLAPLLDIMYGYFNSKNASVRREAVIAVSSLIITCHTLFAKQKDRMMTEFKKLLATGEASDRNTVSEALTRIGVGVGKQGAQIEADVAILYNQVIEDCKRDRDAHLDLMLKMTEFGSVVLGPKITEHVPYILPLILEYAAISVQDDTEKQRRNVSEQLANRKKSALISLYNMIGVMHREDFLSAQHEITSTIRRILSDLGHSTNESIRIALKVLVEHTRKLFVKGDVEWCTTERMWQHWSSFTSLLLDCIQFVDLFMMKSQFLATLTEIFKHLCEVSTITQPFVTLNLMRHLTETVFSTLTSQSYEAEIAGVPFTELLDYDLQITKLMDAGCSARTDKLAFWRFADAILGTLPHIFSERGLNEYRLLEAALISTVFDHFGYEFLENNNRMKSLSMIFACFQVMSATMCQCLTKYIYLTATKYPRFLPPPDKVEGLDNWFDYVLESDISRDSHPHLYDSSLLALSSLINYEATLYLSEGAQTKDREKIRKRIEGHVTTMTNMFPPAVNSDGKDGSLAIHQFCRLLNTTQVYFEGDEGALLKIKVVRALQETLEMPKYNTQEVHEIVDPVVEKLRAQ